MAAHPAPATTQTAIAFASDGPAAATGPVAATGDPKVVTRQSGSDSVRRGYFAHVTYPRTLTTSQSARIDVKLVHLHGQTPKDAYRQIRLTASARGGPWRVIDTATPTRRNPVTFTFTTPTEPGTYRVRLSLQRATQSNGRSGQRPLRPQRPLTTSPIRINVHTPIPAGPRGSADDWSSISGKSIDGTPVRWDPCTPIRWAFNANGTDTTYPQAHADLSATLARISARTGLRFENVGTTDRVPYKTTDAILPADDAVADLFIGFATGSEVNSFSAGVVGLGGPLYYRKAIDNTLWIDTAAVLLNTGLVDAMRTIDETSRRTLRSLMAHEVLHALGLGHAVGEFEIMYPSLTDNFRFGAGDLTGMQVHGATHGCAPGYPATTAHGYPGRAPAPREPSEPIADILSDASLRR